MLSFFLKYVWLTSTFYLQSEKLISKVFYCSVFACFIIFNKKYWTKYHFWTMNSKLYHCVLASMTLWSHKLPEGRCCLLWQKQVVWKVTSQGNLVINSQQGRSWGRSCTRYITSLVIGLSLLKQALPVISVYVGNTPVKYLFSDHSF